MLLDSAAPPPNRRPVRDPAVRLLHDDAAGHPVEHLVDLRTRPELTPSEPALAASRRSLLGAARPVGGVAEEERVHRREEHGGHGGERGPGEDAAEGADGRGLLPKHAAAAAAVAAGASAAEAVVDEPRRGAPHDARGGSPRREQKRWEVPVFFMMEEEGRTGEQRKERERERERESGEKPLLFFFFLWCDPPPPPPKRTPYQTPNASSIADRSTPVAALPDASRPLPETAAATTANFVR